ncbi:hypothetical protein ACM66B_004186 [Microbotryomycetes sp. NB124-2]
MRSGKKLDMIDRVEKPAEDVKGQLETATADRVHRSQRSSTLAASPSDTFQSTSEAGPESRGRPEREPVPPARCFKSAPRRRTNLRISTHESPDSRLSQTITRSPSSLINSSTDQHLSSLPASPASPVSSLGSINGGVSPTVTFSAPRRQASMSPTRHRRMSRSSTRSILSFSGPPSPVTSFGSSSEQMNSGTATVFTTAAASFTASPVRIARRVSLYVASQTERPPSSISRVKRNRQKFGVGNGEETTSSDEEDGSSAHWVPGLRYDMSDSATIKRKASLYRLNGAAFSDSELGSIQRRQTDALLSTLSPKVHANSPSQLSNRPAYQRHVTIDVQFLTSKEDDEFDLLTSLTTIPASNQKRPRKQFRPILSEFEPVVQHQQVPTRPPSPIKTLSSAFTRRSSLVVQRSRLPRPVSRVTHADTILARSKSVTSVCADHKPVLATRHRHSFTPQSDYASIELNAGLMDQGQQHCSAVAAECWFPHASPPPLMTRFCDREATRGALRVTNQAECCI